MERTPTVLFTVTTPRQASITGSMGSAPSSRCTRPATPADSAMRRTRRPQAFSPGSSGWTFTSRCASGAAPRAKLPTARAIAESLSGKSE